MKNTPQDSPEAVWDLVSKIRTAMLVTRTPGDYDARPLQAYPDPDKGIVQFMTDSERLLSQVESDPHILLSFAGNGGNDYVALSGTAVISNDREKIRELWTVWAEAFWDSAEDPKIRVLTLKPDHARYWNGPNRVAATIAMVASVVSGHPPKLGESGELAL